MGLLDYLLNPSAGILSGGQAQLSPFMGLQSPGGKMQDRLLDATGNMQFRADPYSIFSSPNAVSGGRFQQPPAGNNAPFSLGQGFGPQASVPGLGPVDMTPGTAAGAEPMPPAAPRGQPMAYAPPPAMANPLAGNMGPMARQTGGSRFSDFMNGPRGDALMGLLSGWASGGTMRESLAAGGQGAVEGLRKGKGRQSLSKFLDKQGVDPETKQFLMENPQVAQEYVASAFKKPDATNDLREYQYALSQGFNGSFLDYQTALKKAGATNVNVGDNSGAFAKKADEMAATRLSDYVSEGNTASQFLGDMNLLTDIAKNLETGKPAEMLLKLGPYANALGVDIKDLGPAQAYDATVKRLIPQMRKPGSGTTSDIDAMNFMKSLPSLGNTPEGNKIIIDTFSAISRAKMEAAEISRKALNGEIPWQDADRQIGALGDPYAAFNEYRKRAGQGGGSAIIDGYTITPVTQ